MTLAQQAIVGINSAHEFFNRSTRNLTEAEATLRPAPGMMTAAQQVAHAAQTIDWFMEGAFRPEGFDLDFEAHARAVEGVTTLADARGWTVNDVTNRLAVVRRAFRGHVLRLLRDACASDEEFESEARAILGEGRG